MESRLTQDGGSPEASLRAQWLSSALDLSDAQDPVPIAREQGPVPGPPERTRWHAAAASLVLHVAAVAVLLQMPVAGRPLPSPEVQWVDLAVFSPPELPPPPKPEPSVRPPPKGAPKPAVETAAEVERPAAPPPPPMPEDPRPEPVEPPAAPKFADPPPAPRPPGPKGAPQPQPAPTVEAARRQPPVVQEPQPAPRRPGESVASAPPGGPATTGPAPGSSGGKAARSGSTAGGGGAAGLPLGTGLALGRAGPGVVALPLGDWPSAGATAPFTGRGRGGAGGWSAEGETGRGGSGQATPGDAASATAAYGGVVRAQIERWREYPALARKTRQEGTCLVRARVARDGEVAGVEVVRSSGRSLLDKAALSAVLRAGRFPPVPREIAGNPVVIEVPVCFRLEDP